MSEFVLVQECIDVVDCLFISIILQLDVIVSTIPLLLLPIVVVVVSLIELMLLIVILLIL